MTVSDIKTLFSFYLRSLLQLLLVQSNRYLRGPLERISTCLQGNQPRAIPKFREKNCIIFCCAPQMHMYKRKTGVQANLMLFSRQFHLPVQAASKHNPPNSFTVFGEKNMIAG